MHSQAALDAAAKALGMTSTDLQAQLWEVGKTLADIATAQKVDIATVQAAVLAAEKAEAKTADYRGRYGRHHHPGQSRLADQRAGQGLLGGRALRAASASGGRMAAWAVAVTVDAAVSVARTGQFPTAQHYAHHAQHGHFQRHGVLISRFHLPGNTD